MMVRPNLLLCLSALVSFVTATPLPSSNAAPAASVPLDPRAVSRSIEPRENGLMILIGSTLADSWDVMGEPTLEQFLARPIRDPLRTARRRLLTDIQIVFKHYGWNFVPQPGPPNSWDYPVRQSEKGYVDTLRQNYQALSQADVKALEESSRTLQSAMHYDVYQWLRVIGNVDRALLKYLSPTDPRVQAWNRLLQDSKSVYRKLGKPAWSIETDVAQILAYFETSNYNEFLYDVTTDDKDMLKQDVERLRSAWRIEAL
ncbi:hypothetical protein FRB99_008192 [Tulasnella sp. 403]|nr:hypothetical protein FRB99_008192 [Tulasnella sp. 403]